MAKPFQPRSILKHVSNDLLREFFTRRGELLQVPWDSLPETSIEPVFDAWQALPEKQLHEVQALLRSIHALADPRGVGVLAEEVAARCPQRQAEFAAIEGMHDKAMWVHLHLPSVFLSATRFAEADAFSAGSWRECTGLPRVNLAVTPRMLEELGRELVAFYAPTQLRGRHCHVEHFRRLGGVDYFFAFLDDYPNRDLVFEDGSDTPSLRSVRSAFHVVITYDGARGNYAVHASGGEKVWYPLQEIFCRAVLGVRIDPAAPQRRVFTLDSVMSRDCRLPVDPADGIEEVRVTRLRLAKRFGGGHIEVKADPKASPGDIYDKLESWTAEGVFTPASAKVMQATFSIKLGRGDGKRPSTLTFDITAPNSCNLKGKTDEERIVGERCLRRWGIFNDN